ncbi:hypothetical protein NP493_3084g00001 [Ridgeia piscesae]|uniref:NACHT domain-containing protein n=1 Tax=Ridgeia piscesae TaxID=27915 RepID=A0AAD9MXH2_RIDPI|nr:hypothetical protein NP493_3084g00001 [Ridgeia piscesae]
MEKYLKDTNFFKDIAVTKFSDIYIEPFVYESGEYKRLDTRSNINCLSSQTDVGQCEPVKVEELILPDPESGISAPKVLVTGSAGSGKSMLPMYLLDMWLEGKLPAFENIFIYSMKELSRVEEKCSLADLLFMHQYVYQRSSDEIAAEYVQRMSEKTLVVFDGLDAFDSYSSGSETFECNDPVEMSMLIGSIISGHTLRLVTLLVTSRPVGVDEYKKFDQVAEIYGFVEPMIDEYVEKYCQGEVTLKHHIDNFISSNVNVSSLCHLPIFCSLLCQMGKHGLDRDKETPFPTTMTQLITKCMENFVREQHPDFAGKERGRQDAIAVIKDQFLGHSTLAKDGMCQQPVKVIFSSEEFKKLSKETIRCGFLNVSTERKQVIIHTKVTQSYSAHLVMQEFFAAIALMSSLEEIKKLLDRTPNEGQLDMVLSFIAGLVGDPENKTFLEALGYDTTTKAANQEHKEKLHAFEYNIIIAIDKLLDLVVTQCNINERTRRRSCDHKASLLLLLRLLYEAQKPYEWTEIKRFVLKYKTELDLSGT